MPSRTALRRAELAPLHRAQRSHGCSAAAGPKGW